MKVCRRTWSNIINWNNISHSVTNFIWTVYYNISYDMLTLWIQKLGLHKKRLQRIACLIVSYSNSPFKFNFVTIFLHWTNLWYRALRNIMYQHSQSLVFITKCVLFSKGFDICQAEKTFVMMLMNHYITSTRPVCCATITSLHHIFLSVKTKYLEHSQFR